MAWCLGIDVSEFQSSIDWPAVADEGIRFAILRTGDGRYADPTFAGHYDGARKAGLLVGAYHFLRDSIAPVEMVQRMARIIDGRALDLPWCLDYESTSGVNRPRPWIDDVWQETAVVSGRAPMVYTARSFWLANVGESAVCAQGPLWVANYTRMTPYVPPLKQWPERALAAPTWTGIEGTWDAWDMWQFTSQGNVPGVADVNNLDVNLIDEVVLAELAGVDPPPVDVPEPDPMGDTLPTHMLRRTDGAIFAAFASGIVRSIGPTEYELFRGKDVPMLNVGDQEAAQLLWAATPASSQIARLVPATPAVVPVA